MLKRILPKAKNIGIILNYGESNSTFILEQIKKKAKEFELEILHQSAQDTATIAQAMNALLPKIDALFLIQDNTTASALPLILNLCKKQQIPVFASFPEAIEKGALFGLACDDYSVGQQTGNMAVKLLNGTHISNLPIEEAKSFATYVNIKTAKELNIQMPQAFLESAKHF